jgi:hypothetical protein
VVGGADTNVISSYSPIPEGNMMQTGFGMYEGDTRGALSFGCCKFWKLQNLTRPCSTE